MAFYRFNQTSTPFYNMEIKFKNPSKSRQVRNDEGTFLVSLEKLEASLDGFGARTKA